MPRFSLYTEAMSDFHRRVESLPFLGIGISTEYGASRSDRALKPEELRRAAPGFGSFLEIGLEAAKGLDEDARRWVAAGLPCTYHFLDVNLDHPEDLDEVWLARVRDLIQELRPAWLCGDAGLWHFGGRERAQMLLLPPILTDDSATRMAEGIVRLREELGLEVLPENPPGQVFIGDLHILDFFARVCDRADTGMLLDCAHLAIYQRLQGESWDCGLRDFPLERVVEVHVAGAREREHEGFGWVEDDHCLNVLPDTWQIVDQVVSGARNLRAVVLECERNPLQEAMVGFEALAKRLESSDFGQRRLELHP